MSPQTSVHWFRKGLRLHDNSAFMAALKEVEGQSVELRPVYVLDPTFYEKFRMGANRWRFLHQSLMDLDKSLRNLGSRLFFFQGNPEAVFTKLFDEWNVQRLTFEVEIEPYSQERDRKILRLARQFDVDVVEKSGHTLYNPDVVVQTNLGKVPMTYVKCVSILESLGKPAESLPAPKEIPIGCRLRDDNIKDSQYDVPSLADLKVDESALGPCLYPGGETEGLLRLEQSLSAKDWVCAFEKPKSSPNSLKPSTTVLSPYLSMGCISPRLFYHKLCKILNGRKHSEPPVSLLGQLYWREFYYVVAAATPNFDKMVGNKVCCQIKWDENPAFLQAWEQGKTGYPFIDAIMRQLREEGWIHHLARHAVACFLTRGDLYLSWEAGEKVFEEFLIDWDWSLNAGNWMWLSASAFYHAYYRVYSPVAFGKKTDKNGEYIRKYVPEVRKLPPQYLFEPWEAPKQVQVAAKCVIGKDYPKRIIIHEEIYKKNIGRMAEAYKENKQPSESEGKRSVSPSTSGGKGKGKKKK